MMPLRLRRWPNVEPTLIEGVVFAELELFVKVVDKALHRCHTWSPYKVSPHPVTIGCHQLEELVYLKT